MDHSNVNNYIINKTSDFILHVAFQPASSRSGVYLDSEKIFVRFLLFYSTFHRKGGRERHLPRVLRHAGTGVRQRKKRRVRLGQLDRGGEHAQPRLLPILQRVRHGLAGPRGQRGGPHRRRDGFRRAHRSHRRPRHRARGGTLSIVSGIK